MSFALLRASSRDPATIPHVAPPVGEYREPPCTTDSLPSDSQFERPSSQARTGNEVRHQPWNSNMRGHHVLKGATRTAPFQQVASPGNGFPCTCRQCLQLLKDVTLAIRRHRG
eukprot:CAMPEP_0195054064 /NCGR_PEP_ID=MMETSP0448-20130528/3052_1 /TAXON_ID=66468 /ORGANISM="Heterocapsa triquestra, Strain CCMP 448" /LENGTH=112 /DNA_ID=CAMNT_0040083473 /DNA_START=141 /DNA_END=475 /DNA_ORIENTATION=-